MEALAAEAATRRIRDFRKALRVLGGVSLVVGTYEIKGSVQWPQAKRRVRQTCPSHPEACSKKTSNNQTCFQDGKIHAKSCEKNM